MKLNKKVAVAVSALSALVILSVGCGKKPGSAPQETAPAADAGSGEAAAPAAGGTGTIKGKVNFTGTAPVMPDLNRQADPFCAKTKMTAEYVLVNSNNTLKNVAVRVIGASGGEPGDAKVTVDQTNCMYTPRVQTAWPDEEVIIVNNDPTLHNVHTYSGTKTLFNRAQPKGTPPIKKKFSMDAGDIVKFKCDVHPWMTGWLILNDNGFSAVTSDTGDFTIENVPAGTYTLKSFQEHYGQKEIEVTVEADKTAEVELSYDGTEKAAYMFQEVHIGMAGHNHGHVH